MDLKDLPNMDQYWHNLPTNLLSTTEAEPDQIGIDNRDKTNKCKNAIKDLQKNQES